MARYGQQGTALMKINQMAKITIKDIAREAGVSVGLVSMTLNGKSGVSPKTADTIMKVIKKLNYTPNKAASALRGGYKKTIGVITPDLANHYFSDISRHIENIAYDNGYTVLFGSSDDRIDKIGRLVETFHSDGVKGILLSPCDGCEEELRKAMSMGIKVVLMNRDLPTLENVGRILLDNDKAIQMGLQHLLDNGYRHLEMISNDIRLSTLNMRERSYLKIMKDMGFGDIAKVSYVDEKDAAALDKCVSDAVKRGADAFFIPRGYLALHVSNAIKRLGLRIPEDLAIIGFDGGETYRIATPTLTQLSQNTRETAEDAFNMLIDMMKNGSPGKDIYLEPKLEEGESTRKR